MCPPHFTPLDEPRHGVRSEEEEEEERQHTSSSIIIHSFELSMVCNACCIALSFLLVLPCALGGTAAAAAAGPRPSPSATRAQRPTAVAALRLLSAQGPG